MKNDKSFDDEKKLPTRIDKALAWLINSRDKWKEKCMETKLRLKRQTFEVKRLKASRHDWKLSNIRLKYDLLNCRQKISSLQKLVIDLETQIKDYKNEIQVVKKKR